MSLNDKDRLLEMAEQQFLGFAHARNGESIYYLAIGMGLTKEEWEILRGEELMLNEIDIAALDNHFGIGERKESKS